MSRLITRIINITAVVLSLAAVSCRREESPRSIDNPETPIAIETAPQEAILIAADEANAEINGTSRSDTGLTIFFAETFNYKGKPYDKLTVEQKYIKTLSETSSGVTISFVDGKSVSLSYQKEVALNLDSRLILKGYPGEAKTLSFKVIKAGRGDISVSVKGKDGFVPTIDYHNETRSGTLFFTFAEEQGHCDEATIVLTDGKSVSTYELTATTYSMSISAEDIILNASDGSVSELSYTVESDAPDKTVTLTPQGDFFSFSENTVTALSENRTGQNREGAIVITPYVNSLSASTVTVKIIQENASERNDVVRFKDSSFRNAMLSVADSDKDGYVSFDEALEVKEIDISGKGVKDLSGLEYFKNVWKLDAQNNDITDGTVIKNLPLLYWLDLKGNKNLKTFDVTGCTVYFEHCEFEVTDELVYYAHRYQYGVACASDPYFRHSPDVPDNSVTTDWSAHKRMTLVRKHTKVLNTKDFPRLLSYLDGVVPTVVFMGMGFTDKDINDGSWNRLVTDVRDYYFSQTVLKNYLDYVDVYTLDYLQDEREKYHIDPSWSGYSDEYKNATSLYETDYRDSHLFAYEYLYGDTDGEISRFFGSVPSETYPPQLLIQVQLNSIPYVNHSGKIYFNRRIRRPDMLSEDEYYDNGMDFQEVLIFSLSRSCTPETSLDDILQMIYLNERIEGFFEESDI